MEDDDGQNSIHENIFLKPQKYSICGVGRIGNYKTTQNKLAH